MDDKFEGRRRIPANQVKFAVPILDPGADLASDPRPTLPSPDGGIPAFVKDAIEFSTELRKESDRGAVLIGAAHLDEALKKMLMALIDTKMHQDLIKSYTAPIGSFGARLNVLYGMGLITADEYKDIKLINKVRNIFAHEIRVSFSDDRVVSHCSNLTSYRRYIEKAEDYKDVFITNCIMIGNQLIPRPNYISHIRSYLLTRSEEVDAFNKKLQQF